MAIVNYDAVLVGHLRKMVQALNRTGFVEPPVATRGCTRAQMVEGFVEGIEKCAADGTLDDVPEDVYNYYCSIMIPDEDVPSEDGDSPDVNEGYVRTEDDDLVDEYRKSAKLQDRDSSGGVDDERQLDIFDDVSDDPSEEADPSEDFLDDMSGEEDLQEDFIEDEDLHEDPSEEVDPPEETQPPPKRGRGRPKKVSSEAPETPKRGRGRPKKVSSEAPETPKRGRGRPKKAAAPVSETPKRGRGRPKKAAAVEKVDNVVFLDGAAQAPTEKNVGEDGTKTVRSPASPSRKKVGKTRASKRVAVFCDVVSTGESLTKDQIVAEMIKRKYSADPSPMDALFWASHYLALFDQVGVVEKRGEGRTAAYKYVG